MTVAPQLSRREFVASGTVAAALALAGCGTQRALASTETRTPAAPMRVGYCTLFNQGRWTGPREADGRPSQTLIDAILRRRAGDAEPMYLRVTSAAPAGSEVPARGTAQLQVAQRLVRGGVKLGVAVDIFPDKGHAGQRTVADIVAQARQIRSASDAADGVYDWIFLDHAQFWTPAGGKGLDALQQIIDEVTAVGWPRVMINASGFNDDHLDDLPARAWAMARHFTLLGAADWRTDVPTVVRTQRGAVAASDLDFVDYVHRHRPGSAPILKLEIPSQTVRFRQLSAQDQMTLLRLWSQEGPRRGYHMIYPLYVTGQPAGDQRTAYDSLDVGTFWEQRALMQRNG